MRSEAITLPLHLFARYLKDSCRQKLLSRNPEEVGQEFANSDSALPGLFQGKTEAVWSQTIKGSQSFFQRDKDDSPLGFLREWQHIPFAVTPESVSRPLPSGKESFINDKVSSGGLWSRLTRPDLENGEAGGKLGVEASRQLLRIERTAEDDLHGLVQALDAEG
jgi:hypothetical protein